MEFFELKSSSDANNMYGQFTTIILDYRIGNYYDGSSGYSNYKMYWMTSNNTFYTVIKVENTVIYAYCDEDYMGELGEILSRIGYTGDSKSSD